MRSWCDLRTKKRELLVPQHPGVHPTLGAARRCYGESAQGQLDCAPATLLSPLKMFCEGDYFGWRRYRAPMTVARINTHVVTSRETFRRSRRSPNRRFPNFGRDPGSFRAWSHPKQKAMREAKRLVGSPRARTQGRYSARLNT